MKPQLPSTQPAPRPSVGQPRPSRRRWWLAGWSVMTILALGIAGYSLPAYLTGDPSQSRIPLNPEVVLHFAYIAAHAVPGSLALALGPFLFLPGIRARFPAVHRQLGRVYLISIVAGSLAAAFATVTSVSGLMAQVGFTFLIIAWLYTAWQGYRTIRRGDVQLHRVWMIRSYALTTSAIFLRIFIIAGQAVMAQNPDITFATVYDIAVWSAWVLPLVIAEWFVVQRIMSPHLQRRRPRAARAVPAWAPDAPVAVTAAAMPVSSVR